MTIDLSKIKKVFVVGIGGIGISAIARMMLLEGKEVSGSDMADSQIVSELKSLGIKITIGQDYEIIPTDVDLIVLTTAVAHYDPKLFKLISNGSIPFRTYPQMLGLVTEGKYVIAVSGTHGKTTTTAMIAKVMIDCGYDPSVIVGSLMKESKSNLIVGKSNFFIVEACEYERSFLNIKPTILVITNIEADHLDYYKDITDIKNAFGELVSQTKSAVIYNGEDVNAGAPVNGYKDRMVDYTKYLDKVSKLSVPGVHNRMNAAAVLAVADILNIKEANAMKSLSEFSGTWRRLERKGKTKEGTIIYDDYAHHPTEIKASLQALRELYPSNALATPGKPAKRITVLFQPHLYSRTKAFFDEFTSSFDEADNVFLLPIYFAREDPDPSVSSEKLADAIRMHRGEAVAFRDFTEAEEWVKKMDLGDRDVLVTMGAGEAFKVADEIFKLA